ncbi:hypothetical protein E3P92_02461 [Wallemia ichthyophaga]|nr:hypothetical protein E3P92_02461 [Wallemia ichthyophaga]
MPFIGELPGLWWDEERSKYYPLSMKNKSTSTTTKTIASTNTPITPNHNIHIHRPLHLRYTDILDLKNNQTTKLLRTATARKYHHFYPIRAIAQLGNGKVVVATSQMNSQVQLVDLESDQRRFILESSPGCVVGVVGGGGAAAVAGGEFRGGIGESQSHRVGIIKVASNVTNLFETNFDAQSLVHIASIPNPDYMDCAWDGQRYLLAVGKTLNRIDRSTQRAQRIRYKSDVISVAALSPNETICGLRNGELHLHDWRGRAEPARPVHVFSKSVNRLWRLGEGSVFIISTMFSQLFLHTNTLPLTPTSSMSVESVQTKAFQDQKPGTSGLRKRVKVFQQDHYTENFVWATLQAMKAPSAKGSTLVLGGDGRYYGIECAQKVLKLCAAAGVNKVIVGQNAILSTPAASNLIRKYKADGGILMTASHNPGGPDNDFGIKFNVANGGPAPESVTNDIFNITKTMSTYSIAQLPDLDLSKIGSYKHGNLQVDVVDSVSDYVELLKSIFDFALIKKFLNENPSFKFLFDGLSGVTGSYGQALFLGELGLSKDSVQNATPLPDFGGLHPDPNLTYAHDLVERVEKDQVTFGAASDGDGDRNMIIGKGVFVTPSDSVAIIADWAHVIPYFKGGLKGLARSMPTSGAIDRVAKAKGVEGFEVPTGWKFFGNLMDADRLSICGEESFGTGSDHIREKDGLWAIVAWLNIIAAANESHKGWNIKDILQAHYTKYGRNFFSRYDYEEVDSNGAGKMIDHLQNSFASIQGAQLKATTSDTRFTVKETGNFSYTDPIDGSVSKNQGLYVVFSDGSRIVVRLSGTGSAGATIRLYVEKYSTEKVSGITLYYVVAVDIQPSTSSSSSTSTRMSYEEPPLPIGWIKEYDRNQQAFFYVDTHQTPAHVTWDDPRQNPLYTNLIPSQQQTQPTHPFTKADAPPTKQQVIDQRNVTNNWFEDLARGGKAPTPQPTSNSNSNSIKDLAFGGLGLVALSGVALKNTAVKDTHPSHYLTAGWGSGVRKAVKDDSENDAMIPHRMHADGIVDMTIVAPESAAGKNSGSDESDENDMNDDFVLMPPPTTTDDSLVFPPTVEARVAQLERDVELLKSSQQHIAPNLTTLNSELDNIKTAITLLRRDVSNCAEQRTRTLEKELLDPTKAELSLLKEKIRWLEDSKAAAIKPDDAIDRHIPRPVPKSTPASGKGGSRFSLNDAVMIGAIKWISQHSKLVPSSIGEPGVEFDYPISDELSIKITIPRPEHEKIFAHRQWKGGLHTADRLLNGEISIDNKVVLEVGAGTGLSGIVAGCIHRPASFVLVTDYDDPNLISNLRKNVQDNNKNGVCKVLPHCWGKDVDDLRSLSKTKDGFDVILAADVIWDSFSHASLIETLLQSLKKSDSSRVVLVAGYHTGRHVVQAFLRRARSKGLVPDDNEITEFARGSFSKSYTDLDFDLLDGLEDIDTHREERQKTTIECRLKLAGADQQRAIFGDISGVAEMNDTKGIDKLLLMRVMCADAEYRLCQFGFSTDKVSENEFDLYLKSPDTSPKQKVSFDDDTPQSFANRFKALESRM